MIDPAAYRAAMAELADAYFAAQCARLGPPSGVPAPARLRVEREPSPKRPARQSKRSL